MSDAASAIFTRKFSATQDFDYARLLLHREISIGKSCLSPAVSYRSSRERLRKPDTLFDFAQIGHFIGFRVDTLAPTLRTLRHETLSESVSCRSVLRVGAKVSPRNPIKCPVCAKSNRVSGLRNLSREDLAIFRARRSGCEFRLGRGANRTLY